MGSILTRVCVCARAHAYVRLSVACCFPPFNHTSALSTASFKGSGDNLLVIVAQDDPWKHLVPSDMETYTGRSDTKSVRLELDCEECGHCYDMMAPNDRDPDALTAARAKILARLQEWARV